MEPVVARLYGQDAIAEIEKTSLGKITSFKDGKTLKQREQFVHRAGDKILLTEDEQRRVDAEKKIQSALSKGQLVASVKSVSAGELTVPPEYWKDKDRWMTLYTGLLRWEKGVFVADEAKTGIFGTIERRKVDKIFLEGLDEHSQSGRDLSASPNAGNYAPKAILRTPPAREARLKVYQLEAAMERLFAERVIRVEDCGRKSDPRKRIVRTAIQEVPNDHA